MKKLYFLICLTGLLNLAKAQSKNDQLFQAVFNNEKDKVEVLLKAGCDANYVKIGSPYMEINPLVAAVHNKNLALAKLLLDHKANVNWKDNLKSSAIIYAASNGDLEMVKLLITHGANINDSDAEGKTVLSAAKQADHKELISYIENKQKN